MIVWGGRGRPGIDLADGAAYDPAADSWRTISEPPLVGRYNHSAVWTGKEMIIWGGAQQGGPESEVLSGAAYDPLADSWRELPPAPLPPGYSQTAAWTGHEMIAMTYPSGGRASAAAYDPVSDSWRHLAESPLAGLRAGPAVWTGREVLALSHWPSRLPAGVPSASYDPVTDTWRSVSSPPRGGFSATHPVWSGAEVLFYGYSGVGYHPDSDGWRRLPSLDPPAREDHSAIWAGDRLIVWGGGTDMNSRADGFAYLP